MLLSDYVPRFVAEHDECIAQSTIDCFYNPVVSDFSKYIGRPAQLEDLTSENINGWLSWKLSKQGNLATVACRRRAIMSLWRAASRKKLIPHPNMDELRKLPKLRRIVSAWTQTEMSRFLSHIDHLPDKLLGSDLIPKRLFFSSLIHAAYDTGLRLGDLLSVERSWLHPVSTGGATLTIVQSKTGRPKASFVSEATLGIIEKLIAAIPRKTLVWPLWCRRDTFYWHINKLVADSGIRTGTFRWIRRSGVTHVEMVTPGLGYRYAGHQDPRVTNLHYIDQSQIQSNLITPPPLAG
jgi:integrase